MTDLFVYMPIRRTIKGKDCILWGVETLKTSLKEAQKVKERLKKVHNKTEFIIIKSRTENVWGIYTPMKWDRQFLGMK